MYSKVALSIVGSDSGGGAGIQADLKTFMALKVHGCTAISCITAQNSLGVSCVQAVQKKTLLKQIDALVSDFKISSIKTGMLLNANIVKNVSLKIENYDVPKIVDPVMVSRTGAVLLKKSALDAYKKFLFPQTELLTPNIFEANLITGIEIQSRQDIEDSAEQILKLGSNAVLIKGGGIKKLQGKDFYLDKKGNKNWFTGSQIETENTHGSGCTLSAAICAHRSLGFNLRDSIKEAKIFVEKSLKNSYKIGSGPGPLGHEQRSN